MDDRNWIRLNVYLRIMVMVILIVIAAEIMYYKFGYENPDEVQMKYDLGYNITKVVTCRDALYYYADKEWHIYQKKNISYTYPMINLTELNMIMNTTRPSKFS